MISKMLPSFLLDDMTNKGLYSFVEILTGGLVKYEKTNWCMKKIIREFLPEVLTDKSDISKTRLKHIFQLLKDMTIFRGYQAVCSTPSEAYCAAGIKILDGLEDFPFTALSAMHRKVRGVRGYIPTTLQSPKSGWSRDGLINVIRKKCMKMLLDLSNGNEPTESLAGALGVASLTLKLMLNQPAAIEFRKISPEIEALQNDIARAIFFINDLKRVSLIEVRRVNVLLSPNVEMSIRSLRRAVRNLLTEYLFECSDMDKVPNCLLETLDIIINNRSPRPRLRKSPSSVIHTKELVEEEVQKEVEYVLIVSAQAKEVVWNILPEYAFDRDFSNACMEDLEKSDILYISDDDEQVRENPQYGGNYSHELFSLSNSPDTSHNEISGGKTTKFSFSTSKLEFSDAPVEQKIPFPEQSRSVNQYLEVQEACDAVSMVAYQFIGHMLDELAKMEGLELHQCDRLYLRSNASVLKDSEDSPHTSLAAKFSRMWKDALER